ncbi:hypothetical protein TKK_0006793 [Trichogramma kaykai]
MSSVKIGNLQINDEGNLFTWVLSQDLPLLEKHKVVVSDTFNFCNDDEKIFQLELHHCGINLNPTNCQIVPNCLCVVVWRLVLRSIEQDSSFSGWKYEISVIINKAIVTSRKDDIFRIFVPDSEEAILNYDFNEELGKKFDFERMFLDKKFSDIVIRTASEKEIPAHRILLASASPVFDAMFTHDMLEQKCQLVDMVDISYDTAVEMLRYRGAPHYYIYTGSFKTQEFSMTAELLAAADKYHLRELKKKCEYTLGSNLSTDNVIETLKIADVHDAERSKKKAVHFVKCQLIGTLPFSEMSNMLLGKKSK